MPNEYSVADILDFLSHAGQRGLMPSATAQALSVACRNVFGVLDDAEQVGLNPTDLDAIIKRFTNKRAKDFNPTSLKEYARRTRRAVELYTQWRDNPADFAVKTRNPSSQKKDREKPPEFSAPVGQAAKPADAQLSISGGYQSAFPVRAGRVVTISNLPDDLSANEAERLAQFIRMLAVDSFGTK